MDPITLLRELAAAFRSKDVARVLKVAGEVLKLAADVYAAWSVPGQVTFGACDTSDCEAVACCIEENCTVAGDDAVGALPWGVLVPLIVSALQALLNRKK